MRCVCATYFNYGGDPDCESSRDATGLIYSSVIFAVLAAISLFNALRIFRVVCILLIAKKWKMNAAISTLLFVGLGSLVEFCRHVYTAAAQGPAPSSPDYPTFNSLNRLFLPLTLIFLNQGFMGLSVTWVQLAASAMARNKWNDLLMSALKWSVRFLQVVLAGAIFALAVIDQMDKAAIVGSLLMIVLVPINYLGGKSLRVLLAKGVAPAPGKFDIGKCIQDTNRKLMCSVFPLIGSLLWLTVCLTQTMNEVDSANEITLAPFLLSALFLQFIMWSIYSFFAQSNQGAIEKYMSAKVNGGVVKTGGFFANGVKDTILSGTSRVTPMSGASFVGGGSGASFVSGASGASVVEVFQEEPGEGKTAGME